MSNVLSPPRNGRQLSSRRSLASSKDEVTKRTGATRQRSRSTIVGGRLKSHRGSTVSTLANVEKRKSTGNVAARIDHPDNGEGDGNASPPPNPRRRSTHTKRKSLSVRAKRDSSARIKPQAGEISHGSLIQGQRRGSAQSASRRRVSIAPQGSMTTRGSTANLEDESDSESHDTQSSSGAQSTEGKRKEGHSWKPFRPPDVRNVCFYIVLRFSFCYRYRTRRHAVSLCAITITRRTRNTM